MLVRVTKAGSHTPVAMGLVSIAQAENFSVVTSCVLGVLKTMGNHQVSSLTDYNRCIRGLQNSIELKTWRLFNS